MLDQLAHWADIAGTAFDVLLLLRILGLRLNRIFYFVTLYCAVNVIIDVADLALGTGNHQADALFVYSRFLTALIFPLAAWDSFEGVPATLQAVRRPQLIRLISGMVLTTIFAILIGASADESLSSFDVTTEVALIVWISAAAASLGFIWIMRRIARTQKVLLPPNPTTLTRYFMLTFILELLSGVLIVVAQAGRDVALILQLALGLAGIVVTGWCIVRLQRPADAMPSTGDDLVRR